MEAHLKYIINVIIVVCALILPGMSVAHGFFREVLSKWNYPFRVVSYAIISLSIIFFSAFALSKVSLDITIKRIFAFSIIFCSCLFLLVKYIYREKKDNHFTFKQIPIINTIVVFFLFGVWVFCIPFQPYPGSDSLGMGDIPDYYVLAKNIYLGRGFVNDFFYADFWVGPKLNIHDVINSPSTAARRPLVPYVASYFFYICGFNVYIINIVGCALACLFSYALYGFFISYMLRNRGKVLSALDILFQLISVLICIIPSHFPLFAMGTTTVYELFPFFFLFALFKIKNWTEPYSFLIIALSAGLTTVSRPEGVVLILIFFLVFLLPSLFIAIRRRTVKKVLIFISSTFIGFFIMNIPTIFINYSSTSGGMWYQTLYYDSETNRFKSLYTPWNKFNITVAQENLSKNPDITKILNQKTFSDVESHPIAFGKWLLVDTAMKYIRFFSIFDFKQELYIPIVATSGVSTQFSNEYVNSASGLTKFLTLYIIISQYSGALNLCILITICLILGSFWGVILFLCFFLLGFSILSPVLYVRQALVLSPLVVSAFFLSIFGDHLLKNRILKLFRHFHDPWLFNLIRKTKNSKFIQNISKIFKKASLIFQSKIIVISIVVCISLFLVICIILEAKWFLDNMILSDTARKWEKPLDIIEKYTQPSSVLVCGYPSLVNLMTGRITIGAYSLLDILTPNLERYKPDYILINDKGLMLPKYYSAYNYVMQNYYVIVNDSQDNIMLFKHK